MPSTVLTFVAEVAPERRSAVDAAIAELRMTSANPPHRPFGDIESLHFASVTVFDTPKYLPKLVFESNFDGELDPYLDRLLTVAAPWIHRLFSCCTDYRVPDATQRPAIARYLESHVVKPRAYHIGNVGRSLRRIRQETALREDIAGRIDARLGAGARPVTGDAGYDLVLNEMKRAGSYDWVKEPHARESPREKREPWLRLRGTLLVLAVGLGALLYQFPRATLIGVALVLVILLLHEVLDRPMPPTDLDADHVRRLAAREDHRVQNHLASVTVVKAGPFRWLVLRTVLWAANLIARTSTSGTLSGIPSIHFAHWSILDDGRLLFLSNFGGSWENYLDDFIDKASPGLTAIWSNTVGFPRTRLLVLKGSRDGVAFKAFARQNQIPAGVWYSAYPDLTVQQIDSQSTLREGLASRPAGHDLADWLRRW